MIHSDPVGYPALIILGLGFIPFFAAMLLARRRNKAAAAPAEGGARSRRSLVGIGVQTFGMFIIAVGPVRPLLAATAPRAVLDAVIVGALMAATVALFAGASGALGQNWSLVARTRGDHQLIESGPFAYIRHPIYTALALFALGLAVSYGHLSHVWLGGPFFIAGTWLRIVEEERLLCAMFGSAYDAYAVRVKRFVPGVF